MQEEGREKLPCPHSAVSGVGGSVPWSVGGGGQSTGVLGGRSVRVEG